MRTPEGGQVMPLLSRFKEPTGMSKWQVNEIIEGLKEERERVQEKLNQIDAVLEDMQDELNHM
jgi:CHASE3 domain sensor protein